jgi:hypothetical protein|nr:MAG TPA: hypothetical protein [Caudoviricetes sp.]
MIESQEIVERTFYIALLNETIKRGLTINPTDYLDMTKNPPIPTLEGERKYNQDREAIGSKFISVFGIGNNQSRGIKDVPRITLELKSYYPGSIGLEKEDFDEDNTNIMDLGYETKDILIDVHLCSQTEPEMRTLHHIMYTALPARGYITPYINQTLEEWRKQKISPSGNLYIEVGNYYDHQNLDHGLLEKVYTYTVRDGLIMTKITETNITQIKDISCLLKESQLNIEIQR